MRGPACLLAGAAVVLGSCYRLPIWSGDVPVISPAEREAFETCTGRGKLTGEGGKRLHRRPYLQSVTATSAVVAWAAWPGNLRVEVRKDGELVATSRARYGGDPATRAAKLRHRSDVQAIAPADYYVQRADLVDLEPHTLYCYQLLSETGPLTEPAPLLTAAPPGQTEPIRFVAVGDSGTAGAAEQAVARRIAALPFDFFVFLGDIAYEEGSAAQIQSAFFEVYRELLPFVPSYLTVGNHERVTRNGAPYFDAFILPGVERYYSFDWGDVHFVAIDTTGGYAEQLAWLDRDLGANRLPWVIVFGHHPMYSNSYRGPVIAVRNRFMPVLRRHHVTMVLTGHEHHYERFDARDGIIHVVSGGGGGQLTRLYAKAGTVAQRTVHHFLAFEVTRDALTMRAIDIEGKEFDRLELRRENRPGP